MNLKNKHLKKIAVTLFTLPFIATALLSSTSIRTRAAGETQDTDPAAIYATNKCAICHGANAEKKFDSTKPEAEMIDAILKGKKGEKPPNMPAYEPKGVTAAQAKALVDHMNALKK